MPQRTTGGGLNDGGGVFKGGIYRAKPPRSFLGQCPCAYCPGRVKFPSADGGSILIAESPQIFALTPWSGSTQGIAEAPNWSAPFSKTLKKRASTYKLTQDTPTSLMYYKVSDSNDDTQIDYHVAVSEADAIIDAVDFSNIPSPDISGKDYQFIFETISILIRDEDRGIVDLAKLWTYTGFNIVSGGTGYQVGDIIEASGGTLFAGNPWQLKVSQVSNGKITGLENQNVSGIYSDAPKSFTGGSGIGLTGFFGFNQMFSGTPKGLQIVKTVQIGSGGTGYKVGDILQISGGDFVIPTLIKVEAVDESGAILEISIFQAGYFHSSPPPSRNDSPYAISPQMSFFEGKYFGPPPVYNSSYFTPSFYLNGEIDFYIFNPPGSGAQFNIDFSGTMIAAHGYFNADNSFGGAAFFYSATTLLLDYQVGGGYRDAGSYDVYFVFTDNFIYGQNNPSKKTDTGAWDVETVWVPSDCPEIGALII